MFRLGEANRPGPCGLGSEELVFDKISWNLQSEEDKSFLIGVCNPSGIANKHDTFRSLPAGWWNCAETQAGVSQLANFRKSMKAQSDQTSTFRLVAGAPAPLRSGSQSCGTWTGVLQLCSQPLRQVQLPVDSMLYDSGRIVSSMGVIQEMPISMSTVYLPPKGPTYPAAKALGEAILEPLTREIVLGRHGCRAIAGDFNCPAGSLDGMKQWLDQGWQEIQTLLYQHHGVEPMATCRNSTMPDQLWISPELQSYLVDTGILDVFPDHRVLIGKFQFPAHPEPQRHWQLPLRVPWEKVQPEAMIEQCEDLSAISLRTDSTTALREWCAEVEKLIENSYTADEQFPPGATGRCRTTAPKLRAQQLSVPKASRQGEAVILSSFLGRSVQLWFQQKRRFQHLLQSCRSMSMDPVHAAQRQQTWNAILRAKGFRGQFRRWWPERTHRLQGSPSLLPDLIPTGSTLSLIAEDYMLNYQAYERWNQSRRAASLEAKWQESYTKVFGTVKNDPKDHIDSLVDVKVQQITLVDPGQQIVKVPEPFPTEQVIGWKLNGVPAQVRPRDDHYQVHCDLLLCNGQSLQCEVLVHSTVEINERLEALWTSRWNKHIDVPAEYWSRAMQFSRLHLPEGNMHWPPLTYEMWVSGLKKFKPRAARGPDGWSREDLLHLPRSVVEKFIDFFTALETGHSWPQQWSVALVHCIEKTPQAQSTNSFRPITLFSMLYRWWAGTRASLILAHLSKFAASTQCGFLPNCQASDIWWYVQVCIEQSALSNEPIHGVVADLVKAYNLLPRPPVWQILHRLGIPLHFLDCWGRFLAGARRHFVVRGSCSDGLWSVTGFPEGCPLSCCAMVAIDVLWHYYHATFSPFCEALSYVDNLELVGRDPNEVLQSLQITYT